MSSRSASMGSPFRWFMKAIDVGRHQPRALFGGFALMVAMAMVPTLVQLVLEQGLKAAPSVLLAVSGFSILYGLLVMPPLAGAAYRLLQACETGAPARAGDIFAGYSDRDLAVRMILVGLLSLLLFVVVFAGLYLALPGKEFFTELFARAVATPPGGQPDMSGLPPVPPSFLLWFLGSLFVLLVVSNTYSFAHVQVALGGRGPVAALLDGLLATLRNLLPLIGFSIVAAIVGFIALMLLSVVMGLVLVVAGKISPVLAVALMVPFYFGLGMLFYVVVFGFYYHAWSEVFGLAEATPGDEIAA